MRGVKHHVSAGVGPSGPGDVVPLDEGIRASGRRNKGLRGVRHHVHDVEVPLDPRDVVLPDEGIRVCGE